jgi:hypothetical protein
MPDFIKTPYDEKKWNAIKHSVAKQRGKSIDDFTDRDWATVNAAWHKSEYENIKKSLTSTPGSVSMRSAIKGASTKSGLKMPKPKAQPKPGDKPSLFFKSEIEEFEHVRHPTLCKLRDFMMKKYRK